ncbi:MAG: hypothetical protein C0410_08490 [Anaerolinea sp.]|nr:hypothetical protein [Anaerolinea sp.]
MLGTVALADFVFYRTGGFTPGRQVVPVTMPFELTAGVFSFLIGLKYFRSNFRVALANGISRKTFMLANLPVAALIAVIFPVATIVIVQLHSLFWPITSMSNIFSLSSLSWIWQFLFQFTLYFMLIVSGWAITFAYYRSNTLMKWVITLAACFIFFLPMISSEYYYQNIAPAIREFLLWCIYRPERSPLMMLIVSAVLFEFTFLLIHRAPLKD